MSTKSGWCLPVSYRNPDQAFHDRCTYVDCGCEGHPAKGEPCTLPSVQTPVETTEDGD